MKNFIILSSNRVGSTLLREALNSHSELNVIDEVFCWSCKYFINFRNAKFPKMGINPIGLNEDTDCSDIIKNLFKEYDGFKLHRQQFSDNNPSWNYISNKKIIFLYRENKIKQFISLLQSKRDQVWHVRKNENIPRRNPIKVNIKKLIKFIEFEEKQEAHRLNFFSNSNILKISYEMMSKDFQNSFFDIQNFIGVNPENLEINLKKINKKTIQQSVLNYGEMISSLFNTKYEFMINE